MAKIDLGHKDLLINKQNIVEHLRPVVDQESKYYIVDRLTDAQIAVVVSALRMHHTLVHASGYDVSELHDRNKKTDFYPIQSSIGRYFRDSSGEILRENQIKLSGGLSLCGSCNCMTKGYPTCGKCGAWK